MRNRRGMRLRKDKAMSDKFIINDRPETNLRTADFFYHLPE